jgi:FkbM family methyltransferase
MDGVDYAPRMVPVVVQSGALADDPFVLVDVGCGLGIDSLWRLFEPHLRVEAFDPQVAEIERLGREEQNADVHYHAGLIGLPEDDAFVRRRLAEAPRAAEANPWPRLSTAQALTDAAASGPSEDLEETNDWRLRELALETRRLDEALRASGIRTVDFVKTDTDGGDYEVLLSLEPAIDAFAPLGFVVETAYTGSDSDTVHTFHNVDRFMKRHGYSLITLNVNRYSRAALPAPFVHRILAQTTFGQAIWGDIVYMRDAVVGAEELSPTKLLKLACLFELFRVPDMAAELLLEHRERLASLVDVDRLLDLLTPPLDGRTVTYAEYVAAFRADPTSFYPTDAAPPAPTTVGRLRERAGMLRARLRR